MNLSALRCLKKLKTNNLTYFNMNYDVDYFLKKFEAIPEGLWYTGSFSDPNDATKCCAMGHCTDEIVENLTGLNFMNRNTERMSLYKLGKNLISIHPTGSECDVIIPHINDGKSTIYNQDTPKKRVLAALNDIKKFLEPKLYIKDATKEILAIPQSPEKADVIIKQLETV